VRLGRQTLWSHQWNTTYGMVVILTLTVIRSGDSIRQAV
jgi:hypothetical protein